MKGPIAVDHAALGSELYWMCHRAEELTHLFRTVYGQEHPVVSDAERVRDSLLSLRNSLADVSGDVDGRGHYFPGEEVPRNGGRHLASA